MDAIKILKLIPALFALLLLASCSSSDGGDSNTGTTATTTATTGRVSLLITDAPTDDFDQVNLTVESISFLGEGDGHETIVFDESRTVDLLALQNYSDLLVTAVIPVGTYDKIRLHVSQVELVTFVDGGPMKGTLKEANVFVAGTDKIAVDAVGVALLRMLGTTDEVSKGSIFKQEQIARAVELNLGIASPDEIEFITDGSEESAKLVEKIKEKLAE